MVVEAELILWLHVVSLSCTIFHPQTWAELQESGGRAGGLPSPSALPSPRPLGLLVQASPHFPSGLYIWAACGKGSQGNQGNLKIQSEECHCKVYFRLRREAGFPTVFVGAPKQVLAVLPPPGFSYTPRGEQD